MATLTNDKGLDVVQDATGDGGIALTDNFKALADRAPYQAGSNPGTGDDDTQGFAPGDLRHLGLREQRHRGGGLEIALQAD